MSVLIQGVFEFPTHITFERKNQLLFVPLTLVLFLLFYFILSCFLVIELSPVIICHPHVAQLHQRPKHSSLQFVDEVVHLVGTFDEPGLVCFDAQLHLDHYFVPVHDVDEDVFRHS